MAIDLGQTARKARKAAGEALRDFELPLLAFPVAVVAVVAATFLFPSGKVALWQWWAAAGAVVAEGFFRAPSRRRGAVAAALFAAFLGLVWLLSNVTAAYAWWDPLRYHNPAIMMLADGWNPVHHGTFEGIAQASGMRPEWMNAYHVIAMPKGPWYFCAAALHFTGNQFNLFMPIYPFLFVACAFAVADAFRGESLLVRAAAAVLAVGYVPGFGCLVDGVVALAAAGLLATMYSQIRTGRWHWMRLAVFTFWMAVSKQTSLMHCCAFWAIFIAVKAMLRSRDGFLGKTVATGAVCAALAALASVSPYLSSYVEFGHPFYPRYTGDEQKHPAVNITGDFLERNDDADAMGHVGAYVNAFVSTAAARAYYNAKLGRNDFMPECRVWNTPGLTREPGSPTTAVHKITFVALIAALLLLGGAGERFVAACAFAGSFLMPTEMLGYMRYVPWLLSLRVYCVSAAARQLRRFCGPVLVNVAGIAFAAGVALRFAGEMTRNFADAVECERGVRDFLAAPPVSPLVCAYLEEDGMFVCDLTLKANVELLSERTPAMRDTTVAAMPAEAGAALDGALHVVCAGNFAVIGGDRGGDGPTLARTFFKTLPANAWEAIRGK